MNVMSKQARPQMRTSELEELEAQLRIDEHALEKVRREHPELFYRVTKRLANLLSQKDGAKKHLKEVEADVYLTIRQNAEASGNKMTLPALESQCCVHPDVIEAKNRLHEIEKQYNSWSALKEGYEARGYAIRDLIELFLANYYGADMERKSNFRARAEQAREQRYAQPQPARGNAR